MADDEKESLELTTQASAEDTETTEARDERKLYLDQGRTLKLARDGSQQLVEIRAASGQLELRIKLTDEGPVLQMEAVRVAVTTEEAFEIKCKTFSVEASQDTIIQTGGELKMKAEGEIQLDSPEDIRLRGKIIWLN
jgi:hypothetical protein